MVSHRRKAAYFVKWKAAPCWRLSTRIGNRAKIKSEIEEAIGDLIIGIEHVGSTSVEGMSAKPFIDIDVIIYDYSSFAAAVDGLKSIGYIHEGDLGIKDREAFKYTEKTHLMTHHLYVCPKSSEELRRRAFARAFLPLWAARVPTSLPT